MKMEQNVTKIRVITKEYENRETKIKFLTHRALKKDGTYMDCKFTMDCPNKPENVGEHDIEVNYNDINVSNTGKYPCLWVKNVLSCNDVERENKAKEMF